MYLYLLSIVSFLFTNYFLSITIKKYTYEKFFIYVIFYFILINSINFTYLQNINFFTFQALFCVVILFLYSALYRSVSIKVMIYLFFKETSTNVNNFYKTNFIEKSFYKRIKILFNNNFLIKEKKYFILTSRGKRYLSIFKILQSIYKIKFNG